MLGAILFYSGMGSGLGSGEGLVGDILLDESSRLEILESAWRVLMRKDRRLVDVFLDIVGSWFSLEDLRSELFLRGWLVLDYARGDRGSQVNYVYSVMVNRLRTMVRYWRRRTESGFYEDSDLDRVGYRLVDGFDVVEWLQGRELDMLRLRLACCERLLRESSEELYGLYCSEVGRLVDEVLSDVSCVSRAVLSGELVDEGDESDLGEVVSDGEL